MLRRGRYLVAMILRAWIIRAGGLSRQILRVTSNIDGHASRRHVSTALESSACQLRLSFLTACSLRNSSASSGISYAPAAVRTSAAVVCRTRLPTGQSWLVESALQSHVGAALCLLVRRATKSEAGLSVAHPPSVLSWGGRNKKGISL